MFEGFVETSVSGPDSETFVRYGGEGPAVLLLHGHPRTSSTWWRVAPALVKAGFSVVCPDLRGYGRSRAPQPSADHSAHSKKAAAADVIGVMDALGVERFAVAGHDRGGPVAFRLALDHPQRVTHLAALDCIPISDHLRRLDRPFAEAWFHWWFFAMPDLPERAILPNPDAWYRVPDESRMGRENREEYLAAIRNPEVVRAMLEDYRAGVTIDVRDEEADRAAGRRLSCPVLALWSLHDDLEELHGDPRLIWRDWTDNVTGRGLDSGHHMAEDAPDDLVRELLQFLVIAS